MSHLNPSELVDLLDGRLEPPRAAHAGTCDACRARFDDLRRTLTETAGADVPEPSPMFWDHLSARIRAGIAEPAASDVSRLAWLRWSPRMSLAAAAALAIVVMAGWLLPSKPLDVGQPGTVPAGTAASPREEADEEQAWAAVSAAAELVGWEDVQDAGLAARPGSADSAILDLSDAERAQLIQLIEEELKRSGA